MARMSRRQMIERLASHVKSSRTDVETFSEKWLEEFERQIRPTRSQTSGTEPPDRSSPHTP